MLADQNQIDRTNMVAFVRGKQSGGVAIIRAYQGALVNHVAYMLKGDVAQAEDIVQDTFVKLWKNAPKLIENLNDLYVRAWLYKIATNATIDHKRKFTVIYDSDEMQDLASDDVPLDVSWEHEDRAKLVMELVGQLPERQRAAILLSHFEAMSLKEISRIMELSVEAVESLLARARRRLAEQAKPFKEAM